MEQGDIDGGKPAQRLLFIWEGTLGVLPPSAEVRERLFTRLKWWEKAAGLWAINPAAVTRIWDLWNRYDFRCDLVVTTRPEAFAKALENRLEHEDTPVRHVTAMDPGVLARKLVYMPDVTWVIFGDPAQQFTYGSKGRFMPHDGKLLSLQ